jgi:hypothetical protein
MKCTALLRVLGLTPSIVLGSVPLAHADPNNPTDDDKAAARPFAIEGLRLAQEGDCREAIDRLERAEALVHAPITGLPLGQCRIRLGKLVAGAEALVRVLREPVPSGAPAAWLQAKEYAQAALDAVQPRIARLRFHVSTPPGVEANPEVTVDGEAVLPGFFERGLPIDPGVHHVAVHQPGLKPLETDVELSEGAVRTLSVRLDSPAGLVPLVTTAQITGDPYGAVPGAAPIAPPSLTPAANDPYASGPPTPAPASATTPGPAAPLGARGQASMQPESPAATTASRGPVLALELGARLAYGAPFGGSSGVPGADLDHIVSNTLAPLWLDAGLRIASNWYLGGSVAYGVTSVSDQLNNAGCSQPGVRCSSSDIRLGANVHYHAVPDGRFDPWIGAGVGYEWLSLNVSNSAGRQESSGLSGWELANLQAGLDFRPGPGGFGVGPFASLTFAEYSSASVPSDQNGGTTGQSISNQGVHEWLLVGLRGDYDLKLP